jgi:rhodanese-related sulfurtransferase
MNKTFRERFAELFQRGSVPPIIGEQSSLHEIATQYPHVYEFIERKYGVKVDTEDKPLSLKEFVVKFGLPPAQILFMEVQLAARTQHFQELGAREAQAFLRQNPQTKVLDVREDWERKICALPGAEPLSPQLLDEILTECAKDVPLLLYCHHGIRSTDAATFLADRGFTRVYTLRGGIEAWSTEVDSSVPRYEGAWCN